MGAPEVEVRWAASPTELEGAIAVREQVFCVEQGVSREEELDGLDGDASHIVALAPGGTEVIGTTRLRIGGSQARVGRVAVTREWRERGIASQMLELALERARDRGCESARLAAQIQATGVYQRAGFAVESEPFEEAGIAHVWMGRSLEPS
jgi:predicted GNAT family N-acyltransferase